LNVDTMHALLWPLLAVIAASGGPVSSPSWDKLFDATPYGWVSAVEAVGRDSWIAGGAWGVATSSKGSTHVESTHGHGVLGLFVESPLSAYAFGEGELIWHFDGKTWTEEHVGPLPPRRQRRPFAEHMLYLSHHDEPAPNGPLVALGLSLVLVKQPDGTWAPPPDADKDRLLEAGQTGPKFSGPAKCDVAGWRWFGRNRGAFYCHDRRMFILDKGKLAPKGQLPNRCDHTLNALAEAKGELYASCDSLTLWKTEGEAWHRIAAPKEKGLRELPAISVADGCLFVGGSKAVWRTCDN
jgi:hypothetical protein